MKFSVNHPILFIIVGIIIAVVLGQSVFFLVKAIRRAKELGIKKETIRKTISSSAVFTIAPAVSVLVGVVVLSKALGIALPWLRLSVIGSITYENVAAQNALTAANLSGSETITDPSIFVTVLFVMTVGIAAGLVLVPFVTKRIQGGMNKIGMKDKKWGEIFNNAMFLSSPPLRRRPTASTPMQTDFIFPRSLSIQPRSSSTKRATAGQERQSAPLSFWWL